MKKTRSKHGRVSRQIADITTLSPIVASARAARMLSTGDYGAMVRMGSEKASTFASAMVGMTFASMSAFSRMAFALATPWTSQSARRSSAAFMDASAHIADRTLAPIQKRVVANSRRLGR